MFAEAIKEITNFTRPIYFVERSYGDNVLSSGSATMFFVNEEGCAITCKHVALAILESFELNNKYNKFKEEKKIKDLTALEKEYGYTKGKCIERVIQYPGSVLNIKKVTVFMHKKYDLAIIKFEEFDKIIYKGYAKFISDANNILQGTSVCKLGFPFPEFSNYEYDKNLDRIVFNNKGRVSTPSFPLEGIVTRFVRDDERVFMIETSSPGLRGQSGGPLFDRFGNIIGMQSLTANIHLGFDIENQTIRTGKGPKTVSNHPFIHLGHSLHVDIIKDFLKENNIKFYTN